MFRKLASLILVVAMVVGVSASALATTVTFQEGVSSYAGTQDATIWTISTNEHITDNTKIREGQGATYILCFDISGAAIGSSSTVNSASVQLYLDEQNCTAETVEARIIEDPDGTDPIVSNSSSADVFNQYSTWRYKNETGSVKWDAGGAGSDFTDVDDNASAGSVVVSACAGMAAKTISITSAVQTLVSGSKSHVCMWFKNQDGDGNVNVRSKRAATSSERPLLTIDYTAGGGGGGGSQIITVN